MQWVRNLTMNQEVPGLIPVVTMIGSVEPSDQFVLSSQWPSSQIENWIDKNLGELAYLSGLKLALGKVK